MRLSRFEGGLDGTAAEFDTSVLVGNLLGFDAWSVPHCFVPFAIAFLYDSIMAGILGAYMYESAVVLLHITEYSLDEGGRGRFYPYAGAVSALIQDPLLGVLGSILGVLCATRYGPVIGKPPMAWGIFCLALFGASAVLSEVLWDPPPSAGLFAIVIVPLYLAPMWRKCGEVALREVGGVLMWGAVVLNAACLFAYVSSVLLPGRQGTHSDGHMVYEIMAMGGSVQEIGTMGALLQTPSIWGAVLALPAWKFLRAAL